MIFWICFDHEWLDRQAASFSNGVVNVVQSILVTKWIHKRRRLDISLSLHATEKILQQRKGLHWVK
jgi:hypothetical protein